LPVVEALAARDLWFYQHFSLAPRIALTDLAEVMSLKESSILDFGCGEGLMAKGLARYTKEVHGVDLQSLFDGIEDRFDQVFGVGNGFPPVMSFQAVRANDPLPFDDGRFDCVFAWSVFEHVDDVPFALNEIHRVIRPGGAFFIQIAPLYYSPHGSHFRNILDEPWIHLRFEKEELFKRLRNGSVEKVPAAARESGFNDRSANEIYQHIINGFNSLNKITVGELRTQVQRAGFKIHRLLTTQDSPYEIPADLLELYSRDDLLDEQVVILMTR
jgi:SAM-dependent methyltransferase